MKKIIGIVFFCITMSAVNAQDLQVVNAFIAAGQYDKAKESLDKFFEKPSNANNPEAWYYRAFIYNAQTRAKGISTADANALNHKSVEALKKYKELDPKEKFTKEENNQTLYNQYFSFYQMALNSYNDKNYEQSFNNFKDALEVHDYIYVNKYDGPKDLKMSALDTDVVWNLAILGNELKRNDDVFVYYKKLVDAGLKDPKYLEAYEGVALYYKKNKDAANLNAYIEKGRQTFPNEQFWEDLDIQSNTEGLTGDPLFKKYEELIVRYPSSFYVYYYYGADLLHYVYSDDAKNVNVVGYKNKIPEMLKKALSINNTVDVNMMLANFYYNNSFDLSDSAQRVKGTKPADVAKRNDLMAQSKRSLEECLPYAEKAVDTYSKMDKLKTTEKNNYRLALDMLSEIWRVKGDPNKSKEYKDKKAAI